MSRTPRTETSYKRIAHRLRANCCRDLGCSPSHLTMPAFTAWMAQRKADWSPSTWRQYLAAANFAFGSRISELLHEGNLPHSAPRGCRTSGLKEKRLPPDDLKLLLDHLTDSIRQPHRQNVHLSPTALAIMLLLCGTVTGLRPCEWPNVTLSPSSPGAELVLRVKNAKATNGRAHGPFRHIRLTDLNRYIDSLIRRLVVEAHAAALIGTYERQTASASQVLYRATRRLWPRRKKHYTLYSARHQAAANWKTLLSKEQVAALMGHCSPETATTHYGRRAAGRSQVMPGLRTVIAQAEAADVEAVHAKTAPTAKRAL